MHRSHRSGLGVYNIYTPNRINGPVLSVYSVFAIGRFRPVRDPHRSRATCAEFWQTFSEAFLLKFYGGPGFFGGAELIVSCSQNIFLQEKIAKQW